MCSKLIPSTTFVIKRVKVGEGNEKQPSSRPASDLLLTLTRHQATSALKALYRLGLLWSTGYRREAQSHTDLVLSSGATHGSETPCLRR
uniref:Uncharacterized protein n=1 Tax=Knipowitschia caucasica TaxID=637954 RepID=A0AAV2KYP9_KNICA